jgi:transcriptional regulator with XRE-family HTH domain
MPKFTPISVHDLGEYLREQRQSAQLSLRQLSEVAGISNPYISQIERGLKKPSAEILQSLAKALRISAESLYVRAGILDERTDSREATAFDVTDAILADPKLNDRQRAVLLDVYESFVSEPAASKASKTQKASKPEEPTSLGRAPSAEPKPSPARRSSAVRKPAHKSSPAQKSSPARNASQPASNPTKEKKS